MDSDYVLVDNNLESIDLDNNIPQYFYNSNYLIEYNYYDSITECAKYIRKKIIPHMYDISLTIYDICEAALITNNEFNQLNSFNSTYY